MSLDAALAQHRAGNLAEAERLYRQLLQREPRHARAMQLLGVLYLQRRQTDEAIEMIRRAIAIDPAPADFHSNLGNALMEKGLVEEAIEAYRKAVALRPDYAEAHSNLANALCMRKQFDEAISHCRIALKLKPDYVEAHNNLGNALWGKGLIDEAIAQFRQAILVAPGYVSAHHNLSGALRTRGMMDEAMIECRESLRLWPEFPDAHCQHGVLLLESNRLDDAIAEFREAIRLKPDCGEAWNNLASALHIRGDIDDALAACEQALRFEPNLAEAPMCQAALMAEMGRLDEASVACRRAIELMPDQPEIHSNLIFFLNYWDQADAKMVKEECRQWARRYTANAKRMDRPTDRDWSAGRRLKIGYVSPDFRDHPAGRYFLSLLEAHDPAQVEVFCYYSHATVDDFTRRIQKGAHHWRNILGHTDDEAAAQVRADQIDILVDLAVHTASNRLPIFARKPAPVQATWLGYPGTTGLDEMDFRLTDPYLDPPGQSHEIYVEKSLRLPRTFWCIDASFLNPVEPNPLPALSVGHITFGCLNRFSKVSRGTLELWTRIWRAAPNAHLIIYARAGKYLDDTREFFRSAGIDPQRIRFVGRTSQAPEYFRRYHEFDIGLDPFPYSGGITSIDSLWMGVPMVTLRGKTAVGRGGVSVLSNAGLEDWIADDAEQYVEIAVQKSQELERLSELRAALRQKIRNSPLMDTLAFARDIESAFREMWRSATPR